MKKGTKLIAITIAALAIFFTTNVKAQSVKPDGWRLGIGIDGGVPTGNANSISSFELGGTARLQYGLNSNLALTLTSGYYNFFGKTYNVNIVDPITNTITTTSIKGGSLGMIPVKAGIKAFFTPSFYFGAEAGAGFEVHEPIAGDTKDTKLILSPGLGYATKSWEISARYENFSGQGNNYGLVGLRVAYGFPL
ncbi:MAG TPA: hypothetical protein VGM63_08810 [Mucilaginibacter sp.]|jgi:hypothetical protein